MHTFWRVCVPQLVSIEMSKGRHPQKTPLFWAQYIFFPAQHIQIFGLRLIYGNYTIKDVLDNKCTVFVLKLTKTSKNIANVGLA